MSAHSNRPKQVLKPALYTSRFVNIDGLRLHYLDYGTAGHPMMLCVHGGGANGHWFDFVAPGLKADYHVLAVDLPGHGDSEWSDPLAYTYQGDASAVAKAVEQLDLREFVLIGHSMGGGISVVYAATYPGRVKQLIVVDSTFQLTEHHVASMRDIGNRQGSTYATREDFIAHYRLRPSSTSAAPEVLRHVALHAGRQHADGRWRHKFDRNVFAMRGCFDGMPYWTKIGIPTLLVKASRSRQITPEIFANVKGRYSHVELAEVPDCGHHVMLDNPLGFERIVKKFLLRTRNAE